VTTQTVSIRDAKAKLSELVKRALQGDDIVIAEADTPLVRLVPVAGGDRPRVAGLNQGQVWTSEDFDEPLPDDFWLGSS
jgi:prevent-host-death family protein